MELLVENYCKIIDNITILNNINYTFKGGNVYLILGKNASGKTMFLRALCGFIKATKGRVLLDGKELKKDFDFLPETGVMIESPNFLKWYNGIDNLKLLASIKGKINEQDICEVLKMVGLDGKDKRKYSKYSLGMKQKLGIAQAIMENPNIILLDEPTNALDDDSVQAIKKIIRNLKQDGKIIIIATHDKEELLSISDHVIYLKEGEIYEDK